MYKKIGFIVVKISIMLIALAGVFVPFDNHEMTMTGLEYYINRGTMVLSEDAGIDFYLLLLLFSLYIVAYYKTIIMITNEIKDTFIIIKFHCKNQLIYRIKTIILLLKYGVLEWLMLLITICIVVSYMYKTTVEDMLYIGLDQVKLFLFIILLIIIVISYISSKIGSYMTVVISMMFYVIYNQQINLYIMVGAICVALSVILVEAIYKRGKYK